jgi:protein involved in temperature-dependent protein secretion
MNKADAVRRIEKIQALTEDLLENFPESENESTVAFDELTDANDKLGRVADLIAAEEK